MFPPSDGYQPAYDPLIDVARQIHAVRAVKAQAPQGLYVIGSGYTYLQEFLAPVASAVVRHGWADAVGLGRAVLSYPAMLTDAINGNKMEKKFICRTFSECTTAPRNGLISGCYPLDKFYAQRPEAAQLKALKKSVTDE
jgi:2,4-dienoyl-CoA reductase-like NADH-dependent reductase (Old Yellow Enzyme family)